jgi:hypothetical protein
MWNTWWAITAFMSSSAMWPASPTTTSVASRTNPASVVRRPVRCRLLLVAVVPCGLMLVAVATLLSPVCANQARVSAV